MNVQIIKKGTLRSTGMYNKNASNVYSKLLYYTYMSAQQIDTNPLKQISLWWASISNILPKLACLKVMSGIFIKYAKTYVLHCY